MTARNWAEGLILALLLAFFDWRYMVLAVAVMWYINAQIQYIESFYQQKDSHAPRNSDRPCPVDCEKRRPVDEPPQG